MKKSKCAVTAGGLAIEHYQAASGNPCLREQLLDDLTFAEQLDRPPRAGLQFGVRVDAEVLEHRRRHVIGSTRLCRRGHALGVGRAVCVALLEAAAREEDR